MDQQGSYEEMELPVFRLRLFVTGASSVSVRAINNLQAILDEHLPERYELEIIDAHQNPSLVKSENIMAVPVLIRSFPGPRKQLIGDMSDQHKVLKGLGLI